LDAGADAFVSKGDPPERLLEAVEERIKDRLREAEQYRLIRAAKGSGRSGDLSVCTVIQSHMHKGTWSLERAWEVCETYARYGLPLHWTELTVLSGRLKAPEDNDWHRRQLDWATTPSGETAQAEYGRKLYTLLFSHPAVEAITWWDLADYGSWQGAPAGLVRRDMSPKPLYERLVDLVQHEWHTDVSASADEAGRLRLRGYHGDYAVTVRFGSGQVLTGSFVLRKGGPDAVRVECGEL
jgi:endo-1,4-beta-xylanase